MTTKQNEFITPHVARSTADAQSTCERTTHTRMPKAYLQIVRAKMAIRTSSCIMNVTQEQCRDNNATTRKVIA